MIRHTVIWDIILTQVPRNQWIPLDAIYQAVSQYGDLDDEDYEPQSPSSQLPKWKRNVRNVLQYRKGTGEIRWDGDAKYLVP
jgi:hypothetical protein